MDTGWRSRNPRSAAVPAAAAASEPGRWRFVALSQVCSCCGRDASAPESSRRARTLQSGVQGGGREPKRSATGPRSQRGKREKGAKFSDRFRAAGGAGSGCFDCRRAPPSSGGYNRIWQGNLGQGNGKWEGGGRGMKTPCGTQRFCRVVVQSGGAATNGARLSRPQRQHRRPGVGNFWRCRRCGAAAGGDRPRAENFAAREDLIDPPRRRAAAGAWVHAASPFERPGVFAPARTVQIEAA